MGQVNTIEQDQAKLTTYVGIDEAFAKVFPLLIDQLEIANQQLADGVDTLINGFNYLAQTMSHIDPHALSGQLPEEIVQKISKMQRFSDDLIQMGEKVHSTTVNEATQRQDSDSRHNLNRIVLRTLNMQQMAADISKQAKLISDEIDTTQNALIEQQTPENQAASINLVKTFLHLQVELNKMVIGFQFQDRVTQIIGSVINSLKDLNDYVQEAGEHAKQEGTDIFVNLAEIVSHVERYYISKEQYELTGEHKDDTSDDIELF